MCDMNHAEAFLPPSLVIKACVRLGLEPMPTTVKVYILRRYILRPMEMKLTPTGNKFYGQPE